MRVMIQNRAVVLGLQTLLLAVVALAAAPWAERCEAAKPTFDNPRSFQIITAGFSFVSATNEDGLFAASATVDERGNATGAFAIALPALQVQVLLSARTGRVASDGTASETSVQGPGVVEVEGRVVERDARASLTINDRGDFSVVVGDFSSSGERAFGGVGVLVYNGGDTGTHEVGHWMGMWHTFQDEQPLWIAFGAISLKGQTDVQGYPEIAGLFRDTAEGETGHAHGHLDFLKQVGDPATGRSGQALLGFESSGEGTCFHDDGTETRTGILLDLDLPGGILEFQAPDCAFHDRFPIVELPCPHPCRRTVIVGPAPDPTR